MSRVSGLGVLQAYFIYIFIDTVAAKQHFEHSLSCDFARACFPCTLDAYCKMARL